ncbi:MAG: hypothetical protein ACRDHL_03495, partial [Candidatus Promineifilaceae bacterium]
RWSGLRSNDQQVRERFESLEVALEQLRQEKDTLFRIQSAQSSALKIWPRVWLEEIEKAINHDPNSRRQPAPVPVREE